ncbi:DNA adenine methylase [Actinobacillus equuli]|uniref:DNA adenine methylase n=1 Tax=Actinobacillus equuli TaxID=718 RepID=UPI0024418AF5|nr:DNA adenine methylase [Actinobacillus equuli]WGE48093.1 DNA adenine methylase [Actinobacillus equuli subsp. equuli]
MIYTPLRYPGGKSKFSSNIKKIIEDNGLYGHYIEPYAGGAGVALDLIFNSYCKEIHINDFDIAIYNFWNSIISYPCEFIKLIESTPVTIDEWKKQRYILNDFNNTPNKYSCLEHGFATFFLNRTNRSGILKAGVIGGLTQNGVYKLDCRFNKKSLISRIEKIADIAEYIHVYNLDALDWLTNIDKKVPKNSLIYLDPPYYIKGQGLYRNYYTHDDHILISKELTKIKTPWVVSYDNHPEIKNIYSEYRQREYELNYSAQNKIKGTEVMIYSNQLK